MTTKNYDKFGYGLFVLKSKNSLFNADFSHEPRQLPDDNSTFYATDKSLKYCIRRYVHDLKGDKMVFFWRRNTKEMNPMELAQNYKEVFGKEPRKRKKVKKGELPDDANREAADTLLSCWDVRAFGATFAEADCNVSITGPIQITYGLNKTPQNQARYSSQILSPFKRKEDKGEEDLEQRSLGSESKALEMHLAFDFVINPHTLREHEKKLSEDDVGLFKEALCKGVSYVNSSAKIGSESEFMLYFESDEYSTLPLLKDKLYVTVQDGKTKFDFKDISEILKRYDIKHVELYYEPSFAEIVNAPHGAEVHNIHTLKPL